MKKIELNNQNYELIDDIKEAFDLEIVKEKFTDYFEPFDYVIGDWAYGKLRLKGFNDKTNAHYLPINDITNLETYLEKTCAYGCRWFRLKKIKD